MTARIAVSLEDAKERKWGEGGAGLFGRHFRTSYFAEAHLFFLWGHQNSLYRF